MLTRLLMTVGLRLSPGLVAGATFVVNSTLAAVEVTPGNGVCATAGGVCTFRAAVQEANALAGTHVITLSSGTYTLTIAGRDESNGATGDLNIASNQNITINGVGAATTIVDANGIDRVFRIGFGNLTLTDTTITKNVNPGIGGSGAGGGVYIGSGTATITRSTISGNSGQSGGGIFVAGDAGLGPSTVTVTDSTITQNVVSTTSGGGGLYTLSSGIGKNSVAIANSAGTAPGNCFGTALTDLGNNLEFPGTSCGFSLASDRRANPLPGALAANGGPTQTVSLLSGSPAIDAGDDATCAAAPVSGADQRGVTRPRGAHCDIGTYEFTGPAPSNLKVAATGFTTAALTWTAAGATSYNIKRGTISGSEVLLSSGAATTFSDSGLSTGTTYYYIVSAVGAQGESANSNEVSLTSGRAVTSDFTGDFHADLGTFSSGTGTWAVTGLSNQSWGVASDILVPADYSGAGRVQVAVFRPANGYWYVSGGLSVQWGQAGDIPVPADYTGLGHAQFAVFRPSNGYWYINGGASVQWGQPGDIPVPADYDGDGKIDVAVFRPSSGYWYVRGGVSQAFGQTGDIPVPADYNGDGRADLAVYRPSTLAGGPWWYVQGVGNWTIGSVGDIPVPQDLDGDGRAELVVYRPSTGVYYSYFWPTNTWQTTAAAAGQVPVLLPVSLRKAVVADVDADRRRDPTIYRPSDGMWWTLKSAGGYQAIPWGISGDQPVAADYDGDGRMDRAIYRPSTGTWWLLFSASNYTTYQGVAWGLSTDVPIPGDVDGDGKADLIMYRPSNGTWWALLSTTGYATYRSWTWGLSTDVPVSGDFDGDGVMDITVDRPSTGTWWSLLSSTGFSTYRSWTWGGGDSMAVAGDYDGDGVTDIAVYYPSTGTWYALKSSSNFTTFLYWTWGLSTDVPIVGDFDGDGKADITVYRPSNGTWYSLVSGSGYAFQYWIWGVSGDIPVPNSRTPTAAAVTPLACVQGEWTVVSQSVTYSGWVTVGTSQERQRTTTTEWSRETLVQPANGGPACGPSTQTTTETVTETQPLPQTDLAPPIPELANWQGRMTYYGAMHCNEGAIASAIGSAGLQSEDNVWYYDGTKVYQQMATYTQDSGWYTCAGYTNNAYKSWVLAATSSYELGGWRVFPHGLANDYWRTGETSSRDAAIRLAQYSAYAWSGGASACGLSRETAYILNAYLVAEELGEPRHPQFATAVDNALIQLHQSLVTNQCSLVAPFMMGLTMESLIHYYERTGDPRVPPAIESAADAMWAWLWHPASESFVYVSTDLNRGAPDLNLLIAPAYAWLWQLTGAQSHLDRGDAIFAGGVRRAWLGAGKAFSQNYRSSFDYVKWRSQPPGSIQPLTRYCAKKCP